VKGCERTCIACREVTEPSELIRLVVHPGWQRVVPDLGDKLPGRGAYVHPARACIEQLQSRPSRVQSALRTQAEVGDLLGLTRELLTKQAVSGISVLAASGGLLGGFEQICEAIEKRQVSALIFASNIADRTRTALNEKNNGHILVFELPLTSAELGFKVGKGSRAALAIPFGKKGVPFINQLRRRHQLG